MPAKSLLCSLAVVLLSGVFSIASAQTTLPDPEAYRAAKRLATATFLDSSQPTAERLQAATKLGYPEDSTFAALLRVGTDPSEDDAVRLVALQRYRYDDRYVDAVLAISSNPAEDEALAAGLIEDITRRTTFRQPAELRQRLQSTLRELLDDSRDAVRLAAYRASVSSHDAVAIDKLVESLRSGNAVPVPLPDAIELLDVDGPAKHIVTLRPYLGNPDSTVQAQAARALAVDPESRQAIVSLASNAETPQVVRINALRALSREDEQFMDYSLRLIANRNEAPEIRHAAMKASMIRLNYHEVSAALQISFAQVVQQLASERGILTADGQDVGAEAKKLIPHLRKYFPAVKNFFERR